MTPIELSTTLKFRPDWQIYLWKVVDDDRHTLAAGVHEDGGCARLQSAQEAAAISNCGLPPLQTLDHWAPSPSQLQQLQTLLLPCPFCGCPGELTIDSGSHGYTHKTAHVGCEPCGIRFSHHTEKWTEGCGNFSILHTAVSRLVHRWNHRASAQPKHDGG